LPEGFTSLDGTTPIKLWNMVSDDSGNTKVSVALYDTNNTVVTLAATGGTFSSPWLTYSRARHAGDYYYNKRRHVAANGYITIKIRVLADQGDTADIGELTLRGNW